MEEWQSLKSFKTFDFGSDKNTPLFAAPIFQVGDDIVLNQTSNILQFLAPRLDLAGNNKKDGEAEDSMTIYRLNGLALTALDGFSDEVHDCHHPLGGNFFYEDAKSESLKRSMDYVTNRLPLFLSYFESTLRRNSELDPSADGPWLYGKSLTYPDLVLFQGLSGTTHQFPKALRAARASGKYELVFRHYDAVRERPNIKAYLASERRRPYGNGVYRYHAELDHLPEDEKEVLDPTTYYEEKGEIS